MSELLQRLKKLRAAQQHTSKSIEALLKAKQDTAEMFCTEDSPTEAMRRLIAETLDNACMPEEEWQKLVDQVEKEDAR